MSSVVSTARIPEKRKKPGLCYAVTDDGIELPVIDFTHAAFALDFGRADLAAISEASLRSMKGAGTMPGFVRRWLGKRAARRSIVVRGLLQGAGTYLGGMTTYLQKLGPDNLGEGYAGPLDRRMAASIAAVATRLRMRDMARLMVDGLVPILQATETRPVHVLNIGGGPAADSLNALLVLNKEHPECLVGRRFSVHVLDIEIAGPRFGARALEALVSGDGPLRGLDVTFDHSEYNWDDAARLREVIEALDLSDAAVVASSEGGSSSTALTRRSLRTSRS
jgi:hypothetical protein